MTLRRVWRVARDPDLTLSTGSFPGAAPADQVAHLWLSPCARDSLFGVAVLPLFRFYFLPIPFCIGIALLRYHLWDIDRVINRTLAYGLLTAILLMIYLLLVLAGQYLLSDLLGWSNVLVLVGSTLQVAALFQPLRQRIQRLVDRRFYRHKYDVAKIVAAYSATLRNKVDLNHLREELLHVVQETMHPAHASLWLRSPQRGEKKHHLEKL